MADINQDLARVLTRVMPEFVSLQHCARLSGGASQETYAVDIITRDGPRRLALRRSPGGEIDARDYGGPGLAIEARLMTLARAAGVPVPEGIEDALIVGELSLALWLTVKGVHVSKWQELSALAA